MKLSISALLIAVVLVSGCAQKAVVVPDADSASIPEIERSNFELKIDLPKDYSWQQDINEVKNQEYRRQWITSIPWDQDRKWWGIISTKEKVSKINSAERYISHHHAINRLSCTDAAIHSQQNVPLDGNQTQYARLVCSKNSLDLGTMSDIRVMLKDGFVYQVMSVHLIPPSNSAESIEFTDGAEAAALARKASLSSEVIKNTITICDSEAKQC